MAGLGLGEGSALTAIGGYTSLSSSRGSDELVDELGEASDRSGVGTGGCDCGGGNGGGGT